MGQVEKILSDGDSNFKNGYKNGFVTQHEQHKNNEHKLLNEYNGLRKSDGVKHVSIK